MKHSATLVVFLNGTDSIQFQCAAFSVNASGGSLNTERVIAEVLKSPITERVVAAAKRLYASVVAQSGQVECVWTGRALSTYDVGHIIPFAIWKNNDLWNLLPA